jgi:hypothetical protein
MTAQIFEGVCIACAAAKFGPDAGTAYHAYVNLHPLDATLQCFRCGATFRPIDNLPTPAQALAAAKPYRAAASPEHL